MTVPLPVTGPDVVTLGESLVLLTAAPGRLVTATTLVKSIGGAESNVAIGLARLGLRVGALTRVGDDPFGEEVVRTLRAEGVDVGGVEIDPDRPTGLMVKERPTADRANVYYYRAGSAAAAMDADSVQRGWDRLPGTPRHVHVSGVTLALGPGPRAAVHRLLALARHEGATTSLDANHRRRLWDIDAFRTFCGPVSQTVDDLLVSDEEALALTGRAAPGRDSVEEDTLRCALDELAAAGPQRVVVRRGAAGSLGCTAGGPIIDEPAVTSGPVIDVVGAGDAYTSGYLLDLLRPDTGGRCGSLGSAMALGAWAAGHVVSSVGDWEGLPTAQALGIHRSGTRPVDR